MNYGTSIIAQPGLEVREYAETLASNPSDWFLNYVNGVPSNTGISVNRKSALMLAAFWRAVNLIANDIGRLPLVVYKRTADDGREKDIEHPAYKLLRRKPNPEMTAQTWLTVVGGHLVTAGNHYSYIVRDGGVPVELRPLDPDCTYPFRVDGELWYVTHANGEDVFIRPDDMLHFKGLGYDGLVGYSVIEYGKQVLGHGLAVDTFSAKFYKNGSKIGGILTVPGRINAQAAMNLAKTFAEKQAGAENAHKIMVLEDGAKWQATSFSNEDAQFIETKMQDTRDVANIVGVPPHKLGDNTRTGYNSLEQENQSYLDESLDPRLVGIESESGDKLLTEKEKDSESHYVEFNRQALVRTNMSERYTAYQIGINTRFITPNEVRRRENLNPIPGGDEFPAEPAPAVGGQNQTNDPNKGKAAPKRSEEVFAATRDVLVEAWSRAVTRLTNEAKRASKSPGKFIEFIYDELQQEHRAAIIEMVTPACKMASVTRDTVDPALAVNQVDAFLDSFKSGLAAVADTYTGKQLSGKVAEVLQNFEATAAAEAAEKCLKGTSDEH